MGGQPPLQKVLNAWLFDVIYLSFGQTLDLDGMEANPIPRIGVLDNGQTDTDLAVSWTEPAAACRALRPGD